jgi:hypothetical protein
VYRSFGFGSVAAATITLAITAGSLPFFVPSAVIDDIASRLDTTDAAAARINALTVFGLMVGTLQVARALTDPDLSDQLLARGAETALKLLDDPASSNAGHTDDTPPPPHPPAPH